METSAEYLKRHRLASGFTQKQLGRKAGISRERISKWELGIGKISPEAVLALSDFFGPEFKRRLLPEQKKIPAYAVKVKALRKVLSLDQTAFAQKYGWHQDSISKWETGRKPSDENIVRINELYASIVARRDHEKEAPRPKLKLVTAISELQDDEVNWRSRSACTEIDMFFPKRGVSVTAAKAICATCTVRSECLEYALDNSIKYGIWGGTSEKERRRLRKQRQAS